MSTRLLLDTSSTALQHLLLIFFPVSFPKLARKGKAFGRNFPLWREEKKTGNPGTNFHRLAVEKMSPEYVGLPCALYVDAVYLTKHEKCMWIL